MLRKGFWAACILGVGLSAQVAAGPMPDYKISYTYYPVTGKDTSSINASIFTTSPVVVNGQRFAAITNNKFITSYSAVGTSSGGCEVKNAFVELQSEVVLPRLTPENQSYPVRIEWDRFSKALEHHELLHVQNGRRVALEVANRIAQAKSSQPCSLMRPQLDDYVDGLIDDRGNWDRELDQKTHHGRTQGAVLRQDVR